MIIQIPLIESYNLHPLHETNQFTIVLTARESRSGDTIVSQMRRGRKLRPVSEEQVTHARWIGETAQTAEQHSPLRPLPGFALPLLPLAAS